MKRHLAAAILFSCLLPNLSSAEEVSASVAANALIGKTWSGQNSDGDAYFFWHKGNESGGDFRARFTSSNGRTHAGTWGRSGTDLCWEWPQFGRTVCYVRFELEGVSLSMTKSDGETHSGELVAGNLHGL